MPVKSVTLLVPSSPPYDQEENWFESFVGTNILPIVETCPLKRFWFSRYGDRVRGHFMKFRFDIDDLALVDGQINDLVACFGVTDDGYADYDFVGDLGVGEHSRFLGNNKRHQDPARRANLAFDFLHGAARLSLDCLSGPDPRGYYELEKAKNQRFSLVTSMEQFHHLFCTVTGAPTFIGEASHPTKKPVPEWMSWDEFKGAVNDNPDPPGQSEWKFEKIRPVVV